MSFHDDAYTSLEHAEAAKEPAPPESIELEPLRFDWSPERYKAIQLVKEMNASLDYEHAELAKEPEPCQHVVMPVRFMDEKPAPKPCPCGEVEACKSCLDLESTKSECERFRAMAADVLAVKPKPATAPMSSPVVESAIIPAAFITAVFAGGVLIGLFIAFTVLR